MKRLAAFVLVICCLLTLAACAGKETGEADGGNIENRTQLANPVHECTAEEQTEKTGVDLNVPITAVDVTYSYIESDTSLAQVVFTYQGKMYVYRGQKTDTVQDISGMNYQWTSTADASEGIPYTCYLNDEGQGVALWYSNGISYTLSMQEDAAQELLADMYDIVTGTEK